MPRPASDWNGNGTISTDDEYIELRNTRTQPFDLTGWQLDDVPGGGASPHSLSGVLAPDAIVVIFRSESGITLNDTGDDVRLLTPSGSEWDTHSYTSAGPDQAWSRDEAGEWHDDWLPSPGLPNEGWPTPTPTPTPGTLGEVFISEVVYEGSVAGQGDEFVELWNPSNETISLAEWRIGDEESAGGNEGMYFLPPTEQLAPGETLLIARDAASFQQRFGRWPDYAFRSTPDPNLAPLLERDLTWGTGNWALSDSGDEVPLLDRWGRRVDGIAFRNGDFGALGLTGHDVSAPAPRALHHVAGLHSPNVNDWFAKDLPSPGTPYLIPDTPATPLGPALDGLPVAWGNFHSHGTYSVGSGPPPLAYGVARANGLHFLALSEHSHWYTPAEWQTLR